MSTERNDEKKESSRRRVLTVIRHVVVGVFLYLMFSYSMFLGLQVKPAYGSIGVLTTLALIGFYIWLVNRTK